MNNKVFIEINSLIIFGEYNSHLYQAIRETLQLDRRTPDSTDQHQPRVQVDTRVPKRLRPTQVRAKEHPALGSTRLHQALPALNRRVQGRNPRARWSTSQ